MNNSHNHVKKKDQTNLDMKTSKPESHDDSTVDSLWSNLWYGLFMLAIIILPPMIPGASTQILVISYGGIVIVVYTAACIHKIVTILRLNIITNTRNRRGGSYH